MHTLLRTNSHYSSPSIIGLLRHGQTTWNEAGRIQGQMDSALSRKGTQLVHKWGAFLADYTIDRIVASDLGRVQETVTLLRPYCNSCPVELQRDLREQCWGRWEGNTLTELQHTEQETLSRQIRAGWNFRPPGGESRKEVLHRALAAVQNILRTYPGKRILLVSHEGIIKSIIYHLAQRNFLPEEKKVLQKRQLHILVNSNNTLSLGALNVFPPSIAEQP